MLRRVFKPIERTSAEVTIIVGRMVLFVVLVLLKILAATGDPDAISARGIPLWLSTSFVLSTGSVMITVGALIHPRESAQTAPNLSNAVDDADPTR